MPLQIEAVEQNDDDDEPESQQAGQNDADADAETEARTDALMERVTEILERADREGFDPEDELRQVVGEAVVKQVIEGLDRAPAQER